MQGTEDSVRTFSFVLDMKRIRSYFEISTRLASVALLSSLENLFVVVNVRLATPERESLIKALADKATTGKHMSRSRSFPRNERSYVAYTFEYSSNILC